MARKKSPTLTEAELRLMDIVWKKGEVTVSDVVKALPKGQALAYSTVLTMMRILEEKGYLVHQKSGRAFVYTPVVKQAQAQKNAVQYLLSRFFDNSAALLVQNLLENKDLNDKEVQQLKKLIDFDKKD